MAGGAAHERTDVYRAGATATAVLTDGTSSDATLPDELDDVLSKATADDPDDRYRSVLTFDDDLRWAAFRA